VSDAAALTPRPATLAKQQMEFQRSAETPTVCNVVEMVAREGRGHPALGEPDNASRLEQM